MENYIEQRDEIGTRCFDFIRGLQPEERYDASIFFIFQSLAAACEFDEQHKIILNEAGKAYRKAVKEVTKNDEGYLDYDDISKTE